MCLKFRVKRTEHLLDIIREVESEIEAFHAMHASVIVHQLGDVRISEGDQFLLYLRNLPSKVQEFFQLHQNAATVQQRTAESRFEGQNLFQLWKERSFG